MTEPERILGVMTCRTIEQVNIPSGSSPCMPPLIQKQDPSFLPLIIVIGIDKILPPACFVISIAPSPTSPGEACALPI